MHSPANPGILTILAHQDGQDFQSCPSQLQELHGALFCLGPDYTGRVRDDAGAVGGDASKRCGGVLASQAQGRGLADDMRRVAELVRAPDRIVGYHGCSLPAAQAILAGESPVPSNNPYDWLGKGVYFWEYAPTRALEWARRRFADQAAVLEADVVLGHCLNLLDAEHADAVQATYRAVVEEKTIPLAYLPENSSRGRHELDRMVVEVHCAFSALLATPFDTVRGAFPEGVPLYPGSKILTRTHVQIAVRDVHCIQNWCLLDLDHLS